jgi:putative redox protein
LEAKVIWKGKMSFTGTARTGFEAPIGAEPEVGGDNDGFRPMELLLTGLAGCTAMDVIAILQKKRQEVTAFEVRVDARRAGEHPKVVLSAVLEFHVTGRAVEEDAVRRAIELSSTRYCAAQAMLRQVFPIALKYHIYEDEAEPRLVTSGEFIAAPGD